MKKIFIDSIGYVLSSTRCDIIRVKVHGMWQKQNPGLNSATIYQRPGGHSSSQMVFGSLNCRISGYFKLGAKCGWQNIGKDCGTFSISIFFSFYFFDIIQSGGN